MPKSHTSFSWTLESIENPDSRNNHDQIVMVSTRARCPSWCNPPIYPDLGSAIKNELHAFLVAGGAPAAQCLARGYLNMWPAGGEKPPTLWSIDSPIYLLSHSRPLYFTTCVSVFYQILNSCRVKRWMVKVGKSVFTEMRLCGFRAYILCCGYKVVSWLLVQSSAVNSEQ